MNVRNYLLEQSGKLDAVTDKIWVFVLIFYSEVRRNFIVEKYTNRKYIEHQLDPSLLNQELLEAIELRDIKHLLQVS